jgi:hypothetical protein
MTSQPGWWRNRKERKEWARRLRSEDPGWEVVHPVVHPHKVLRRGTRPVINRAASALRIAASTLLRSRSYLGAQYADCVPSLGLPKPSLPWLTASPA